MMMCGLCQLGSFAGPVTNMTCIYEIICLNRLMNFYAYVLFGTLFMHTYVFYNYRIMHAAFYKFITEVSVIIVMQ